MSPVWPMYVFAIIASFALVIAAGTAYGVALAASFATLDFMLEGHFGGGA